MNTIPRVLVAIITSTLMLLFAYTGSSKLLDMQEFSRQMHLQPLSAFLQEVLTVVVPVAEIIACALLLFVRTRFLGLVLSFLLMLAFTVYVGLILTSSFEFVPCSCAGIFNRLSWKAHLVVNGLFTIMALIAIVLSVKERRAKEMIS